MNRRLNINWGKLADMQRHEVLAVNLIGTQLSGEFGWNVAGDTEEADSYFIHIWQADKSLYHKLVVRSAAFDADGNGTSSTHVEFGDGIDDCLDVDVAVRGGKANVSELHEALRLLFATPHKHLALDPKERCKVCHHEHRRWTGSIPNTGRYACTMCGTDGSNSQHG